jgi:hypothetical protein
LGGDLSVEGGRILLATFNPAFASENVMLFGSVRYFCANPDAVRASCMFTFGVVEVLGFGVAVEDVGFRREFRKSLTCVESIAVPKALRS